MLIGVLLAFLSNILYPLSFTMIRKVENKVHPVFICTIRMLVACCAFVLVGLGTGFFKAIYQISAIIWGILFVSLLGLDIFGDITYFYAQKRLGTTKAITIAMLYPFFTILFAYPLLHQPWKWTLFLSAFVICIGIYFLTPRSARKLPSSSSLEQQQLALQSSNPPTIHLTDTTIGFFLAFLTAILWALGIIATEYGLQQVENIVHLGFLSSFVANMIRYPLGLLFIIPLERITIRTPLKAVNKRTWIWLLASSILGVFNIYLFGESTRLLGASIYALLSTTAPLFAYPLTFFLNKERLSWWNFIGVIFLVLGISIIFLQ